MASTLARGRTAKPNRRSRKDTPRSARRMRILALVREPTRSADFSAPPRFAGRISRPHTWLGRRGLLREADVSNEAPSYSAREAMTLAGMPAPRGYASPRNAHREPPPADTVGAVARHAPLADGRLSVELGAVAVHLKMLHRDLEGDRQATTREPGVFYVNGHLWMGHQPPHVWQRSSADGPPWGGRGIDSRSTVGGHRRRRVAVGQGRDCGDAERAMVHA